jgi:hypothetical protein
MDVTVKMSVAKFSDHIKVEEIKSLDEGKVIKNAKLQFR